MYNVLIQSSEDTDMELIYRVEHKTAKPTESFLSAVNLGVYRQGNVMISTIDGGDNDIHPAPAPHNDPLIGCEWEYLKNREYYVFGFKSLEQLLKWFPMLFENDRAKEHLRIGVYSTVNVLHGKYQSITYIRGTELWDVIDIGDFDVNTI